MSEARGGIGILFQRWSGFDWEDIAEINSITGQPYFSWVYKW